MRFTIGLCFIMMGTIIFGAEKQADKTKLSDYKKSSVKNEKVKVQKNDKKNSWNIENLNYDYQKDEYDQSPLTDYEWELMTEKILAIENKAHSEYKKIQKNIKNK